MSSNVAGITPVADLSNYPTLVADIGAQQWKVGVYQIIITLHLISFGTMSSGWHPQTSCWRDVKKSVAIIRVALIINRVR